ELLDVLEVAHHNGVVHRDVKPANLILLGDGRLKVTDFGIALLQGRELVKTKAGVVLATPKFASPEQLRGMTVDGRADIFAVGVLLYLMLTGRYPFEGSNFMELASAIFERDPTPPHEIETNVPEALSAVIARALVKDRDRRYENCREMSNRLRSLAGLPATTSVTAAATAVSDQAETASLVQVRSGLPQDTGLAIVKLLSKWAQRELEAQPTHRLLDRLLERPVHAEAFAGAAFVGGVCLLCHDGRLLAAIDVTTGEHGDPVMERLPAHGKPRLALVPEGITPRLVSLLATPLHPPQVRHGNLDSSFINLPALAEKLRGEHFDGLLRLQRGEAWGMVFYDRGDSVLSVYSVGWEDVPINQTWERWVSQVAVRASVEELVIQPPAIWYRRSLPNLTFQVDAEAIKSGNGDSVRNSSTSSLIRQLFSTSGRNSTDTLPVSLRLRLEADPPAGIAFEMDPVYRFLLWMLEQLPAIFIRQNKASRWKYLIEWLFIIQRVILHHPLPRPNSGERDFFDLVTRDEDDRALHLVQRIARPNVEIFNAFIEKAKTAKMARTKTGDVGGVMMISPSFDSDVLEAYNQQVTTGSTGIFGSSQEAFTGYEGFVRLGARRGFHLLLIQENSDGSFTPILPSSGR
ncbi:MAG: serine/threonine-protein kinase, partial [Acidobacteriota bacterium]